VSNKRPYLLGDCFNPLLGVSRPISRSTLDLPPVPATSIAGTSKRNHGNSRYMSENTKTAASTDGDGPDIIVIENLLLPAEIGVLDSEKGRRQSVRFDVEIETVPGYRRIVSESGTYVSYADTVLFIQQKAKDGGHVELVEEWAEAIAAFVLSNPLAARVVVKVTKPDIFEDADGVGIRIARRRT